MKLNLLIFGLVLLSACGPKPGSQHLPQLREALQAVDSAANRFEMAPHFDVAKARSRADSALASVEARMQGLVVNLEQGRPFSLLDERCRLLKKQPGRQRRIEQEIDRTRRQIGQLIEAIVDGAKVDALGAPIDDLYLENATADELRISSHLTEEIDIALNFLERGLTNLDGLIADADSASRALVAIPATSRP
ncbi:hypothetical protein OAO65_00035 [Flavobacteriales bacterium]|nr:hypothetical protein [Flavobacteriales bacterium]